MEKYKHKEIEKKWQEKWVKDQAFKAQNPQSKEKYYILDMFSYPSGEGLHMGHTEQSAATDTLYRYKTMKGFDVLHPQGFDSFGLPAENFAIKTGIHPKQSTQKAINTFKKQMSDLGLAYNFKGNIVTSDPSYYKWTQYIFAKFFENDLVYKKSSKANWCPSCSTVIANEQVVAGLCERCDSKIEQKDIPSWMFRITKFADDLIEGLSRLDWPEHTKKNQINWIGKSTGAHIDFEIKGISQKIKIFTTRPDTIFGATYMVLAPEHTIIKSLSENIKNIPEVEKYILETKNKTELQRLEAKEKTGVELKGLKAINPANQKEIPIFISDYVLAAYGTGAVMAVPAHDQRDNQFAQNFNLEVVEVVSDNGVLINSGIFDGLGAEEAKKKITASTDGEITSTYRLRDWSISRQRYWGTPIPVVYSPEGEPKFVGEENLPWLLPEDVDFKPTGESPLANSKELVERVENLFGKGWTPEVDTMDTFVDSSWYFLRYADPENKNKFASKEALKKWLPVDLYIGGAEHTYMHLLYARFFTRAMKKCGLVDFDEPFLKLRHQGMVNDASGKKMSKSKGNVVNPTEMIERFGADATRVYMLFASPLEDDVVWNEDNIVGVYRFLEKVWRQKEKISDKENQDFKKALHKTIKKVGEDMEKLRFNVSISDMMKLANLADKESSINEKDYFDFIKILSPFAPHIADEIAGEFNFQKDWPSFNPNLIKENKITMAVQVNGKRRAEVEISVGASEEEVKGLVFANPELQKWATIENTKKFIYIPDKIINIVL